MVAEEVVEAVDDLLLVVERTLEVGPFKGVASREFDLRLAETRARGTVSLPSSHELAPAARRL